MKTDAQDPRIDRTRRVVLDAAIAVIAERGFLGATIDAIAQRCGVARSTIYRHWPERNDLLLDAVAVKVEPIETFAVGDLRADLVAIGTHLAELLGSEPMGSVAAALILESRRDPALERLRDKFVSHRRREIAQVMQRASDRGQIPPGADMASMANDLVGQVFFQALVLHVPMGRTWVEDHVDRWLRRYEAG
ncbi:MAG: TetR/AcrR family transcriptional regulator [Chloroflexota bacterium]